MKSRDEIVIIMIQWLRLYTLGSRGSRELKTFLETRLISSRVDQKLTTKEGRIHGFKEKIRPEVSGRLTRSWSGIDGHDRVAIVRHQFEASWLQFFY